MISVHALAWLILRDKRSSHNGRSRMSSSGTTVLVVDDDVVLARAMMRALEAKGHAVAVAHSAADARRQMNDWTARSFAVVILDQCLGDGFGTDLLPEFTALMPSPAIGLFSGSFDFLLARSAYEAGAIAFPRPVNPEDLTQVVEYLAIRNVRNATPVKLESQFGRRAIRAFGNFFLKGISLSTPRGVLELRPSSAAVLAYLIDRRMEWVSTDELALEVFGRKPELQGGRGLVYHHVYSLKSELADYEWLVDSRRSVGYRLAPSAILASTGHDPRSEISPRSIEAGSFLREDQRPRASGSRDR